MRKIKAIVLAGVTLSWLLAPQAAHALAFTLASSVTLSDPNSTLQVTFSPDFTISGANTCLAGSCTLTNDFVVFHVQVTHTSGTTPVVDEIGASVTALNTLEGVGVFTAGSDVEPSGGSIAGDPQAIWDFDDPPGANLTSGDFSDPLFVTYNNDGGLFSVGVGRTVNFMVHPVGGVLFSSPPSTTLVLVPEPGTLGLAASMLAILALLRSRHRRKG